MEGVEDDKAKDGNRREKERRIEVRRSHGGSVREARACDKKHRNRKELRREKARRSEGRGRKRRRRSGTEK